MRLSRQDEASECRSRKAPGSSVCAQSRVCSIQGHPLFKNVRVEVWRRFHLSVTAHAHRAGDKLFYQGNPPLGVYFICAGRVKLVQEGPGGRSQIVRIVKAPDLLGERAFIAEAPYACTAEVMEPAHILFMEAGAFWSLFGENAQLLRGIARRLALALGRSEAYMNCLASCTVTGRMAAHLLSSRTNSPKARTPGCEFTLTESRMELAEVLGTSPEAVSRSLSELRAKGLLAVKGRTIRILQEAGLRRVSCLP